jgi:putative methionine-R-sulfoxide reductase with GAF domain
MGNGFGMGPYQQLLSATVDSVANGAQMPDAMHNAMRLSQNCGVFLIEGSAAGADLVVEGWIGEDDDAQKAVDCAANIRISSVCAAAGSWESTIWSFRAPSTRGSNTRSAYWP